MASIAAAAASNASDVGVILPLPQGTAASLQEARRIELERRRRLTLQQQRQQQRRRQPSGDEDNKDDVDDSSGDRGDRDVVVDDDAIGDGEREIMAYVRPIGDTYSSCEEEEEEEGEEDRGQGDSDPNDEEAEEDEDGWDDGDAERTVPLHPPPPTLPVLLVDLEKLCGYAPETNEERNILADQIVEALLGNPGTEAEGEGENSGTAPSPPPTVTAGDGLSLDFDSRSAELLESGVAIHADTSNVDCLAREAIRERRRRQRQRRPFDPDRDKAGSNGSNEPSTEDKGGETGDNIDNEKVVGVDKAIVSHVAIVPYPEFFLPSTATNDTRPRSTAQAWKVLLRPHPAPPVHRLLSHLRDASRPLQWKLEMSRSLRRLARDERRAKERRDREEAALEWKTVTRPARLSELYGVREAFEMRLDAARARWDTLVQEREGRVEAELRRRREAGLGCGGINGLDLDFAALGVEGKEGVGVEDVAAEGFAFEEGGGGFGLASIRLDNGAMGEAGSDDYESGYDCSDKGDQGHSSDDTGGVADEGVQDEFPPAADGDEALFAGDANSGTHRRATPRRHSRRRLAAHSDHSHLAERRRARVTAARAEESMVREGLRTTNERTAEAAVRELERRLERVDGLLESLQEEEWADEEEEEARAAEVLCRSRSMHDRHTGAPGSFPDGSAGGVGTDDGGDDNVGADMTLLDQILAMVLGALPRSPGRSGSEEHFRHLHKEHASIVSGWRDYFGRLPRDLSTSPATPTDDSSSNSDQQRAATVLASTTCRNVLPEIENMAGTHTPTTESSAALRLALGITDNEEEDCWDDVEDWDELLPALSTAEGGGAAPVKTPRSRPDVSSKGRIMALTPRTAVGLRPGGRAQR